jgi:hypothetical protein
MNDEDAIVGSMTNRVELTSCQVPPVYKDA